MSVQLVKTARATIGRAKKLTGQHLLLADTDGEVVIASVQVPDNLWALIESFAFDAGAGATSFVSYRVTINGQDLPYDWSHGDQPRGAIGTPWPVNEAVGPGALIEVRATNTDTVNQYDVFSDGEVSFYASRP